ncbi:class I SAM-dependent methyltransferase [Niabella ginsenosidivorans]|uniref:class I SAM-dependent methyltransferase n=1 Tax=Niabella ginsenosidivorans TaxID=1176587 RepID=UPI001471337B|nr:class I SAM-dependent methyltransferase [Niabella ginsenosidivorans]
MYPSIQKLTPKNIYLKKCFGSKPFRLLDVGAGNHSASKTKKLFPNCEYHGIDLDKSYQNDPSDFDAMTAFYEMDLTKLDYKMIPDNYFDFVRMAHVVEHLKNGDEVVKHLIPKLKQGGCFYIEYPGARSTKLPSMRGTLNFYDDPTHVRIYSVKELQAIFESGGCRVISSGVRRNAAYLITMPLRILGSWARGRKLQGNIFWDLMGFAEFLFVQKIR